MDEQTDEFTQAVIVAEVESRTALTWATRSGLAWSWVLAGVGVIGMMIGVVTRMRARRDVRSQQESTDVG